MFRRTRRELALLRMMSTGSGGIVDVERDPVLIISFLLSDPSLPKRVTVGSARENYRLNLLLFSFILPAAKKEGGETDLNLELNVKNKETAHRPCSLSANENVWLDDNPPLCGLQGTCLRNDRCPVLKPEKPFYSRQRVSTFLLIGQFLKTTLNA